MHILMYHEITDGNPSDIHAVDLQRFIEQMSWLEQAGYQVFSLAEWVGALRSGKRVGNSTRKRASATVVITFDDGYRDNYTLALPVLLEHAYPATIFLSTGMIGATSTWREGALANSPMLTWAQIREMAGLGLNFGSHSVSHADLTRLDEAAMRKEIYESRQQIEQQLGQRVNLLSYPYGPSTPTVKQQVQAAGYLGACTCRPFYVGAAGRDPFELQRISVLASDSLPDFATKLRGSLRRRLLWHRSQLRHWLRGGRL